MEPMRALLGEFYRRVYATPGRRMPEEVLREIAIVVSHANFCTVDPAELIDDNCGPDCILCSFEFLYFFNKNSMFLFLFLKFCDGILLIIIIIITTYYCYYYYYYYY